MTAPAVQAAREDLLAGRAARARSSLARYLATRPTDVEALRLMAGACAGAGDHAGALPFADRAVRLADSPDVRLERASLRRVCADWEGALADARAAADLAPADPSVARALGELLLLAGRQDEAVGALEGAVGRLGEEPGLLLALAYAHNVAGVAPPAHERDVHARLAAAQTLGVVPASPGEFPNPRDPDRALRVALLSSDLRLHSCAFFLEGWLAHLDTSRVKVFLYSTTREPDGVTARLRTAGEFRDVASFDARALAAQARADAIDILIDANAWTAPSQARALARRLAPVQVSFLGYPNTTGLAAMDRRLVDGLTDPEGAEAACTEALTRIDTCLWCFHAEGDWPAPAESSSMRGAGPVTFGSFNHAAKIGPRVVAAWARILKGVPGSVLLLKSPPGAEPPPWHARFRAHGVDPARLRILPQVPDTAGHLALYHGVDVALDPFPYNGTTTTCEAVWMGVPVVALAGDRHRARVGVSLLTCVGHPELVAQGEEGYVRTGVALAEDVDRRRRLRASLRPAMAASPLCDGPGYARRVEAALGEIWRDLCRG